MYGTRTGYISTILIYDVSIQNEQIAPAYWPDINLPDGYRCFYARK